MMRVWCAEILGSRLVWAFALVLPLLVIYCPTASAIPPVGLSELISEIWVALGDAKRLSREKPYFLVKELQMELQVIQMTSAKGELGIPVLPAKLSLAGELQTSETQTISVTLKPSEEIVVSSKSRINFGEVIAQLKKVFKQEREQKRPQNFIITSLKYEVQFLLQEAGTGKIDLLFVNIEGSRQTSRANKLTFTLCETVTLKECA